MREAVELEQRFIEDCLPVEGVGLSAEDFSTYIDYIADRRLVSVGLDPLRDVALENPLPWLAELMDVRKEQNFFEGRVTEYQKAAVAGRRRRRGALGHGHRVRRDPAGPRAQARGCARRLTSVTRPTLTDALAVRDRPTSRRGDDGPRTSPAGRRRRRRDGGARARAGEAEANTAAAAGDRARDDRRSSCLACDGAATVTIHDLSSIVEAVADRGRPVDVARRWCCAARCRRRWRPRQRPRLIRRSGDVAVVGPGARSRSRSARRSCRSRTDPEPAVALAARVDERARALGLLYVPIETVQDIVQEELVLGGHMRVAERYIVYRAERALLRARAVEAPRRRCIPADVAARSRTETCGGASRSRRSGSASTWTPTSSRRSCAGPSTRACTTTTCGGSSCSTRRRSSSATRAVAVRRAHPAHVRLRGDAGLGRPRRRVAGAARRARARAAARLASTASTIGRIDPRLLEYDLERLAAALDPSADLDFDFLGLQTLYDRYLICRQDGRGDRARLEAPQIFWLRVAMGVCLAEPEDERDDRAHRALHHVQEPPLLLRRRRPCSTPGRCTRSCRAPATSTRSTTPSSSIVGRGIAENAMCSKWAGGLGRLVDSGARHGLAHRVAPTARARASCRS